MGRALAQNIKIPRSSAQKQSKLYWDSLTVGPRLCEIGQKRYLLFTLFRQLFYLIFTQHWTHLLAHPSNPQ